MYSLRLELTCAISYLGAREYGILSRQGFYDDDVILFADPITYIFTVYTGLRPVLEPSDCANVHIST